MELNDETYFHCANYGLWTSIGYLIAPSTWRARGCVILDQRPEWHRHFLQSGVTRAVLLPDKLNQLLSAMGDAAEIFPTKNLALHASGGFISRALAEKIIARVTKNLIVSYGSTEVPIASLESLVTDLDDLHWLAPTHVRCVEIDDDAGAICPVNVEGRIRMLGRSADVVNFRGQKYSVSPIEDNIRNFLGVNTACLFSGINDAGEEEVVIAIESEQWPDKSLLDHLGHEFEQFDQIRFAIVFPFPITQTGITKIDRAALRKLVFSVE